MTRCRSPAQPLPDSPHQQQRRFARLVPRWRRRGRRRGAQRSGRGLRELQHRRRDGPTARHGAVPVQVSRAAGGRRRRRGRGRELGRGRQPGGRGLGKAGDGDRRRGRIPIEVSRAGPGRRGRRSGAAERAGGGAGEKDEGGPAHATEPSPFRLAGRPGEGAVGRGGGRLAQGSGRVGAAL